MLISKTYKFIFVHIPKTAGTSIRAVLSPVSSDIRQFINIKCDKSVAQIKNDHLDASEIKELIPPNVWDSYFKFAFVRNPWGLMLSHCLYFKNNPGSSLLHRQAKTLDFNSYIAWYFNREFDCAKFTRGFSPFVSIGKKLVLDYVGKYENIDTDFRNVVKQLGIKHIEKLPTKNVTKHTHYTDYYNDKSKKLVETAFQEYLHYFEYRF